jgi:L-iditol 2-dehydrogenase
MIENARMRAAVLRSWNEILVEDVPRPALETGEVLVRVRACGLCGTDLKMVSGGFAGRWPPALPFIIGHEWSGVVEELGPGLEGSELAVGDRVVAENHSGCGACGRCKAGRYNLCERAGRGEFKLYGHTADGALAEFAARPAKVLYRIPDSVSDIEGALINQGAMAVHALRRTAFAPGGTVVVFGPGLLGLLTVAVARAAGASKVVMVGRGARLATALEMGCDAVVDYDHGDPVEGVRQELGTLGADYVFDCTGNPVVLEQAFGVVRRGGKIAVLGLAGEQQSTFRPDTLVRDEVDLLGIRSSPNAYPAMIDLVASGALELKPLLTHVYGLDQVGIALEALRTREAIRPIIQI